MFSFKHIASIACIYAGISLSIYSQNYNKIKCDSLITLFNTSTNDSALFQYANKIYDLTSDIHLRVKYANISFNISNKLDNNLYRGASKLRLGIALKKLSDNTNAYDELMKGLEYYKKANSEQGIIVIFSYLSLIHSENHEYENALSYLNKSLKLYKRKFDTIRIASTLLNIGEIKRLQGINKEAITISQEALQIFKEKKYNTGIGYSLGNIGLVYLAKDSLIKASHHLQEAISILNPLNDNYSVSVYQEGLAHVYQKQGNYRAAEEMANNSLVLATEDGLIEQIRDANFRLSEIYYQSQQYRKAYQAQAQYVTYKDSLINEKNIREIENLRRQYEVAQKQAEVDELTKKQRYYTVMGIALVVIVFLLAVMALILYRYSRRKKRVNQQLQSQQKELEQLNQTKDHFFSIISHDLRSPIATFQSIMEVFDSMVEHRKFDDLKHVSLNMKQSSNYIMELVENLFSWGMNQKGAIPFQPEPLMLQECVGGVVDVLGVIAQNKSVALKCDIHSSIQLEADQQMLQAIIRNLINNALKFTHTGGRVTISANESKEKVSISVADTGVGIHPDHLPSLFELDAHKSTPGTDNEKGVGLGLQLVHEFVEKHDGKIEVKSELGKGTEMVIILPKKIIKQCQ